MALGEQLRNARLAMKLRPSEVAAATRMKVQIVEALEREDFSKIAAPIYGKGFIRMYAQHVGLDAKPLIDDYLALIGATPGTPGTQPSPPASASYSSTPQRDRPTGARSRVTVVPVPWKEFVDSRGPTIPGAGFVLPVKES